MEQSAVGAASRRQPRILICDDHGPNVLLLERVCELAGYVDVTSTTNGRRLLELCEGAPPDLILLDLHMPEPNGFALMERLRPMLDGPWLPVIVLTGDTSVQTRQRALALGARDLLTKPFDQTEVVLRMRNVLEARFLHLELEQQNRKLEDLVRERTADLEEARLELLERLALAAEYRDDATGRHAQRVGQTAAALYRAVGRPEADVELIRLAAPLHDVGKIGIPDAVLLKPGRLTPLEYEAMKGHVDVSRRILSGSRSPLLRLAEEIALSHHEKWDGSGYPVGLRGDDIPLCGRVAAIADVFDTLTHTRPYKRAWPLEEALDEIRAQSGRHFDPDLVETFLTLEPRRLLVTV